MKYFWKIEIETDIKSLYIFFFIGHSRIARKKCVTSQVLLIKCLIWQFSLKIFRQILYYQNLRLSFRKRDIYFPQEYLQVRIAYIQFIAMCKLL